MAGQRGGRQPARPGPRGGGGADTEGVAPKLVAGKRIGHCCRRRCGSDSEQAAGARYFGIDGVGAPLVPYGLAHL